MNNLTDKPKSRKSLITIPSFWSVLYGFRVRTALLLMVSLLTVISILALAWNTSYVINKKNDAEDIVWINTVLQRTLTLYTVLAQERGFTSVLLANSGNYNAESRQRLFEIRSKVDQNLLFLRDNLQSASSSSSAAAAYIFFQVFILKHGC